MNDNILVLILDGKINSLIFCENSLSLAAATENANIHVYK